LNSGLHASRAGILPPEPHLQSIFALVILDMRSEELFTGAGLKPQFPISASQIARITDVSHYAQHIISVLTCKALIHFDLFVYGVR
jgi:hypothetical protein